MSAKVGLPVKIFAGVMMGGLVGFIGLAVMPEAAQGGVSLSGAVARR